MLADPSVDAAPRRLVGGGVGSPLRRVAGRLLAAVVGLWIRSLRVVVEQELGTTTSDGGPRVYAFFHGQQMLLLGAMGRRRLTVMVSLSKDGELQAAVMTRLGLGVVRGSSSRGGAVALSRLVRVLRRGGDVAIAVDGPRGPAEIPKPGAAGAAAAAQATLLPVAAVASRSLVLGRAWDRFEIPLPFSRVVVVIGAPVPALPAGGNQGHLGARIVAARERAKGLAERGRARAVLAEGPAS